jgi:hypothetical protein
MKSLVLGIALVAALTVAPSLAGAWHSGEVVIDGYRLPRDHRFESPDSNSKYHVVNINDVPGLIKGGRFVFDRTGNVWIKHPNGTMNPQYLAAASTGAPGVTGAPAATGDWVVIGEYRLPRDHRFETPDASGKYNVVNVNDVPGLIKSGRFVFDRTAKVWVKHPNGTMNSQYLATAAAPAATAPSGSKWDRVRGTVQSVSGKTAVVRTDEGRNVTVDMSQASSSPSALKPGDRVVVGGSMDASNRVAARYVREDARGTAAADEGQWQRVHGHVQSVRGSALTFKADDGRVLSVDMSDVGAEIRRALSPNEGATVIGFPGKGNQFRAEYIQQDSSDAARASQTAAAPAAVKEPPSQRIHGQVVAVAPSSIDFKTDDGSVMVVDLRQVDPGIVRSLRSGESVTVVGHVRDNGTRFDARDVLRDGSR